MTLLENCVGTPAAQALGWTLVHSLWEGALIALALAAALLVVRSSRARYASACLAMVAMLASFAVTFSRQMPLAAHRLLEETIAGSPAPVGATPTAAIHAQFAAADYLPWLAPLWAAGVMLFQLRCLASWMAARRLRRRGVCSAPDLWQQRLVRLGSRLRVSRPVLLLETSLAEVPVVIGHLRPAILIPVGLLAGLPAAQIELILLHELAHIRRRDYLMNLVQVYIESVLFYHPAVWWMSGIIRTERENCCDDLVVSASGDAHEYAVALAVLETTRQAPREPALAATGGNLMKRIRRLLNQPEGPRGGLVPVLSAGVLTITAALALAAWQAAPSLPADSPFYKWLNQDVVYIISGQERTAFESLRTDEERQQFVEQFWLRRDPTPATPRNEFKEEHYRRIAYANEHWRSSNPGWKTDRGRIYIMFGPPNEIESHPSGQGAEKPAPFEQWRYGWIEGVGNNVVMEFVDATRSGDYRMTSDPSGPSGGRLYVSNGRPDAQVTVEITPDRKMQVKIPLDFAAKQYSVTGTTQGPSGWKNTFHTTQKLCKYAPGEFGCLSEPALRPGPSIMEPLTLAPGAYMFDAVVEDTAGGNRGGNRRAYKVNFTVN